MLDGEFSVNLGRGVVAAAVVLPVLVRQQRTIANLEISNFDVVYK